MAPPAVARRHRWVMLRVLAAVAVVGFTRAAAAEAEQEAVPSWHPRRRPPPKHAEAGAGAAEVSSGSAEARRRTRAPDAAPDLFALLPEGGALGGGHANACWEAGGETRCLPGAMVLGNFQCGVRDVHARLALHPRVARARNAQPHFWDEERKAGEYLDAFGGEVARKIAEDPATLTLDASPSTFAFTWTASVRVHANYSMAFRACHAACPEPKRACTRAKCFGEALDADRPAFEDDLQLPDVVRAAYDRLGAKLPRLVVVLRDPVERLHAAFWFYGHYQSRYGKSEEGFAEYAREQVGHLRRCEEEEGGMRPCAMFFEGLSPENEDVFYHGDQVFKSLYSYYAEGWVRAFGREALLFLRLEDWRDPAKRPGELRRVLDHLGLPEPDDDVWERMLSLQPTTAGGANRPPTPRADMDPETRRFLREFFSPFNADLARTVGDERFEWKDR